LGDFISVKEWKAITIRVAFSILRQSTLFTPLCTALYNNNDKKKKREE
jgi:hypothetical protein